MDWEAGRGQVGLFHPEKRSVADNDACNDNYDSNDGNFDDNDDKNYQKTFKYYYLDWEAG